MNRNTWGAVMVMAAGCLAAPAAAQADQLFGIHAGGFFLRSEDSRINGDVLVNNLSVSDPFVYDIGDFNGPTIGGEYLIGFGDWIEAGVGVSYFQGTVPSYYADSTHVDGSDIQQDIKVRIVPVTASVRFFPVGRTVPVQPYVGVGVNFYRWRYSESGEFIDYSDESVSPLPIFRDTFADDGTAAGAIFVGGVRVPAGERFFVGGEFRWQGGSADLDPELLFTGNKLDLGGVTLMGTFHVRF